MPSIFVHIVTFNSARCISACVQSLLQQEQYRPGDNLEIHITDNNSADATCAILEGLTATGVALHRNGVNEGFCAGHNRGVARFLQGRCDYLLILNPDTVLTPTALLHLSAPAERDSRIGLVTPKLLRCDEAMSPISPPTIDAAGMILTEDLRHFDRGSGEVDTGQYDRDSLCFGGTGACLLLSRSAVHDLVFPQTHALLPPTIYPHAPPPDAELFDEAFFAYREDADLSWRAHHFNWECWYASKAIVYHGRVVTPERRATLPPLLNRLSVRNRFLLQLNNFSPRAVNGRWWRGIALRNTLVIAGVLLREWSSLPAFFHLILLLPRAIERRRYIMRKRSRTERLQLCRTISPQS